MSELSNIEKVTQILEIANETNRLDFTERATKLSLAISPLEADLDNLYEEAHEHWADTVGPYPKAKA